MSFFSGPAGPYRAFLPQEKVIPSVVIEPASNHEGEGEQEVTISAESEGATEDLSAVGPAGETSELAAEQKPLEDAQATATAPAGATDQPAPAGAATQDLPPGFLYKVLQCFGSPNHRSFLSSEFSLFKPLFSGFAFTSCHL